MNDNFYLIPDLIPRHWAPASWPSSDFDSDGADEMNRLMVQNLGWFALRVSRIVREAHSAFRTGVALRDAIDKSLEDMETLDRAMRETGFYSDAHRDTWYPAYLYLIDARCRSSVSEMDLQRHIRENLSDYIQGESVPPRPKDYEGLCDLLVVVNGSDCPMEVKLHKFDHKAKKQLRRYMNFYDAPIGYAAAPLLTTELDPDMIFIDVSGWNVKR